MKKISILLLFLLSVGFVNSHSLGRFLVDEPLKRGDISTAYVTIRNPFDDELEDVNVKFYIYELGLRYSSIPNDVEEDDHIVQRLFMHIPGSVPAGEYLTKITVGNDHYRDTQHVVLRII